MHESIICYALKDRICHGNVDNTFKVGLIIVVRLIHMTDITFVDTKTEIEACLPEDIWQDWNLVRALVSGAQKIVDFRILGNLKKGLCRVKGLDLVILT